MSNRRDFIKKVGAAGLGLSVLPASMINAMEQKDLWFKISLAEWSLNRELRSGKMDNLEFPVYAKNTIGVDAVEYVNQFFADKAKDMNYLKNLKDRCDSNGVKSLLIMVDREGDLGNLDKKVRKEAVENHKKWVEAANYLGCHSIRVNAHGFSHDTNESEVAKSSGESLQSLSKFAEDFEISVIVENHGGFSSDGDWLVDVIKTVGRDNCGTLPDFGNNCISRGENRTCEVEYDRYKLVDMLMPYATGVSAKSYEFDDDGNEVGMDYVKLLSIVKKHGYNGYIGIEYEGGGNAEEGILKTKELLMKAGAMV